MLKKKKTKKNASYKYLNDLLSQIGPIPKPSGHSLMRLFCVHEMEKSTIILTLRAQGPWGQRKKKLETAFKERNQ